MTKDEALKLALSALDEVRQETFRLMRNGETLYAEKKVWCAIYTIKKVLAQPKQERTWVGLADEDFYGQSKWQVMAMKYAEAKLKERNT